MANEFKHKDPGAELTQAEYIAACGDGHIFACQATGDLIYADSSTVLKKLARGSTTQMLQIASCKPAWTSTPSLGTTSWCNMNHAHGAGNSGGTVCANVLAGTTLKSCVVTSSLTTVGALNSGSISCGFGAIDNGSSAITTTGLISGGSLDIDNVLINGTTIGHTCDTDLMTVGNACLTIKGAVTVGVDDTGHDVKFFGAAAGAYMLYDQSCDQLEIRGASADATTSTGKLLLSTSLTNVNANDVIGSINFQAPAEAGGTDAIAIAAGIRAVAQATFTCAVNATDLIFYTGHSEAATEKFRFTSQGEIGVGGANYGTDGQVLTSGGAGAAAAWEDAGGGGPCQAVESAIECETNQDTYIPPDLAKHIKGAAKWWVDILLAGAKTGTSYNVACVCDNGTGCRIITYTSAMAEANYPVIGMNRGFTNHSSVVFSECNGTASVKIKIRHGESTYGLHDERNMIVGFGLA